MICKFTFKETRDGNVTCRQLVVLITRGINFRADCGEITPVKLLYESRLTTDGWQIHSSPSSITNQATLPHENAWNWPLITVQWSLKCCQVRLLVNVVKFSCLWPLIWKYIKGWFLIEMSHRTPCSQLLVLMPATPNSLLHFFHSHNCLPRHPVSMLGVLANKTPNNVAPVSCWTLVDYD